jgi:hypothetical protein
MQRLRKVATEAGKNPDDFTVTLVRAEPDKEKLEAYAEAGLTRVLFALPSADRSTLLKVLDEYSPLIG